MERIWKNEFIELEGLLPARLGVPEPTLRELVCGERKGEKKGITCIEEWITCFNAYVAIVLMKMPKRATDLLAYASLIVKASRDYEGEAWRNYDRLF